MTAKYEEPRAMQELHAIREKHYEETRNMTDNEYVEWIHEKANRVMKEFRLEYTEKP